MTTPRVLCIGSDPATIGPLRDGLGPRCVWVGTNPQEALAILQTGCVQLVVIAPSRRPCPDDAAAIVVDDAAVLRILADRFPSIPVVVVTDPAAVESALVLVESAASEMTEISGGPGGRHTVQDVDGSPRSRTELLVLARQSIAARRWDVAWGYASTAVGLDPSRPEALNLLGAILDLQFFPGEATRYYRAAIAIDPSYRPAHRNLDRHLARRGASAVDLGEAPVRAGDARSRASSPPDEAPG